MKGVNSPLHHRKHIAESHVFAEGFVPTLLAGLLIEAITWWLAHGRPYPPQQIASYCRRTSRTQTPTHRLR